MKCDDLRRAIGGISPEMIERADERPRVRRPVKVMLAAAVLLGIMIILTLTVWKTGMKKPEPVKTDDVTDTLERSSPSAPDNITDVTDDPTQSPVNGGDKPDPESDTGNDNSDGKGGAPDSETTAPPANNGSPLNDDPKPRNNSSTPVTDSTTRTDPSPDDHNDPPGDGPDHNCPNKDDPKNDDPKNDDPNNDDPNKDDHDKDGDKLFSDVSVNDWSYNYIEFVVEQGYMAGRTEDRFEPEENVTRAEFIYALYTMAGSPEITSEFYKTHKYYYDVEVDGPYHAAAYWAGKKRIIVDDSNPYFEPDNDIARADIAVMLMQYVKYLGYELDTVESVPEFEDIGLAPYYSREAINVLSGAGVLTGKSNNRFDPLAGVTRAEAAAMIKALIDHSHEKKNGWLLKKYCLDDMRVSVNLDSSGQQFRIKFKSTEGYNGKDLLPWDVMMIGDTGPEHPMTIEADIEGIDCGVHGVRFKFRTRHIVGPQNYEDPVFTFNMPLPTLYYYDDEGNRVYYDYEYEYTPENDYEGYEPGIWGTVHEDEILKVTVKVTIGDESETFVFYPAVTDY